MTMAATLASVTQVAGSHLAPAANMMAVSRAHHCTHRRDHVCTGPLVWAGQSSGWTKIISKNQTEITNDPMTNQLQTQVVISKKHTTTFNN